MDVRYYVHDNGKMPVKDWLNALRDQTTKRRLMMQIDRLGFGNFGDSKSVGEGISELRIHFGTGYRVYYFRLGDEIILLLCAGDKSTQKQDIENAKSYLDNFRVRLQRENDKNKQKRN